MLQIIENSANEIGLNINADKTEFNSLNHNCIKKVSDFKYLRNYIRSTDKDINIKTVKSCAVLSTMTLSGNQEADKIKMDFFKATVESVLINGFISWTLTKSMTEILPTNAKDNIKHINMILGNITQLIKKYMGIYQTYVL